MESCVEIVGCVEFVLPRLFQGAFALVTVASAVTALTPTPRDDEFVGRIYKVVEALALNIGRAKDLPPNKTGGRFVSG